VAHNPSVAARDETARRTLAAVGRRAFAQTFVEIALAALEIAGVVIVSDFVVARPAGMCVAQGRP
jgi:hypothetical protein